MHERDVSACGYGARMTEGVGFGESRFVRSLCLLLLAAAGVRLTASVVAGFVEWHHSTGPIFPAGRARAFDVLTTFGAAGDGTGVLLALAAAAVILWLSWRGDPLGESLRAWVIWVFGVTAALAVAEGVGVGLLFSLQSSDQVARFIQAEGFALAYVIAAVGGVMLTGRFGLLLDEQRVPDNIDAFVFAVDRKSGDVRAFLSVGEASRRMHVYSVEEDEFTFYTDEGVVLDASVDADRIMLRPTDDEQAAELLERLKDFANRRGIRVDPEDVDDPTAYAVPINRWHSLEMWPPWMRPIGMLFRRSR
jgi:hypothetical protein